MKSANKRILAAVLFAVLVFSMALSFSGCGSSAGSETPAPEAAETPAPEAAKTATSEPTPARDFKITGMTCDDNGYVTVTWKDSEDAAPYRVACRYRVSDDPDNTRQLNELLFNGAKDVEGYECTVSRLTPGEPFWVYI